MKSFGASILWLLAVAQVACAMVMLSSHRLAHQALGARVRQHHRHSSHVGERNPENPHESAQDTANVAAASNNDDQSVQGQVAVASTDMVTVAFEAVPAYPESGAKQHVVKLALGRQETIPVPKLAYNIRIDQSSAADIVCHLSVSKNYRASNIWDMTTETYTTSFAEADGMVSLSTPMRRVLESGNAMSKLSCVALNPEL